MYTLELGYKDLGMCDTSSIELYIQYIQPQLIPHNALFLSYLVQHT
jgi:hypothetical protein